MLHIDDLLESLRLPDIQPAVIGFLTIHLIHLAHVAHSYLASLCLDLFLVAAIVAHCLPAEVALGHDISDLDLLLAPRTLLRFTCSHN